MLWRVVVWGKSSSRTLAGTGIVSRLVAVAASAVVAAVLAGCGLMSEPGITAGVVVDNKTDGDLHFETVANGAPYRVVVVANAHETALLLPSALFDHGSCTDGPTVAFDPGNREVARHDAPLCVGDRWTIGPAASGTPGPT
jgi:hypothetical protein